MTVFDKVQPYVESEDGELFDVSFNTNEISFKILELTYGEVTELVGDIMEQVHLLWKAYQSSTGTQTPAPSTRNQNE